MVSMKLDQQQKIIRVFGDNEDVLGNLSTVVRLQKIMNFREISNLAHQVYKKSKIATTCFINEVDSTHFDVQCFSDDKAIQCCGHGMMAAAKVVFENSKISNIVLNQSVSASNKGNEIELTLPRMFSKKSDVPSWTHKAMTFGGGYLLPSQAAISDKLDGYLLLEFNPNLSLDVFSGLLLDLNMVCESTKRAVVIIQFDEKNRHLYTRYFAPQYGVKEDSATGSVMRFVADYIMQTYNIAEFQVNQCSKEGGFMNINCRDKGVVITANVSVESI